jgi:tetratricopeptide (TPR) repeat protein
MLAAWCAVGWAYEGQQAPVELNAAKELYLAGRYGLAQSKLEDYLDQAPAEEPQIEANNLLAFVYYKQDKLEPAYEQFKYTIGLIDAELRKNDPDVAAKTLIDPRFLNTYFAAAEVMVRTGRYVEAYQQIEKTKTSPPFARNPFLHYLRGVALLETGQYDLAVAAFREQERLEPDPITDYLIACTRARQGKPAEALAGLKKAVGRRPELRAQAERDTRCFAALDLTRLGR